MKKLVYAMLALAMAFGAVVTSSNSAEARRGGGLIAGAIVGGVLAGALVAGSRGAYASGPVCHYGPRQCEWAGRHCFYNRFGDYVCRGGDYRCWRPRVCD